MSEFDLPSDPSISPYSDNDSSDNNIQQSVQGIIDSLVDVFQSSAIGQIINRIEQGDLTYDTSKKSYVDDDPIAGFNFNEKTNRFDSTPGIGYGRNYYSETDLREIGDNLPDNIANPRNDNRIAMANARIDRAKALVNKQKELAKAF